MDGGSNRPAPHYPSAYPTSSPSVTDFNYVERTLATQLHITEERAMDDLEQELYVGCVDVVVVGFYSSHVDPMRHCVKVTCPFIVQGSHLVNFAEGGDQTLQQMHETIPSLSILC